MCTIALEDEHRWKKRFITKETATFQKAYVKYKKADV